MLEFRRAEYLALLVVSVASASIGCSSPAADRSRMSTSPGRIVVLGDSLSVSPTPGEAFPALLQKRLLDAGSPWVVDNAGIRGDTTSGGLNRIDALLARRPKILILALGANDGLRGVGPTDIYRNLDAIIKRSKEQQVEVLLCGMELPAVRGLSYARAFRDVFPDLSRAHQTPLVPFLLDGVALNPSMNGSDQIHPNAAGAQKIAETVWPYL